MSKVKKEDLKVGMQFISDAGYKFQISNIAYDIVTCEILEDWETIHKGYKWVFPIHQWSDTASLIQTKPKIDYLGITKGVVGC